MTDATINRIRKFISDRDLLDLLGLDEDEIVNMKMDMNEKKYPVDKARGNNEKYTEL